MSDTPAPAEAPAAPEAPGPQPPVFVSKLSPAEVQLLAIADQITAAFRYLAAQIPSAQPLLGMARNIDAAVAQARDIDR